MLNLFFFYAVLPIAPHCERAAYPQPTVDQQEHRFVLRHAHCIFVCVKAGLFVGFVFRDGRGTKSIRLEFLGIRSDGRRALARGMIGK